MAMFVIGVLMGMAFASATLAFVSVLNAMDEDDDWDDPVDKFMR